MLEDRMTGTVQSSTVRFALPTEATKEFVLKSGEEVVKLFEQTPEDLAANGPFLLGLSFEEGHLFVSTAKPLTLIDIDLVAGLVGGAFTPDLCLA